MHVNIKKAVGIPGPLSRPNSNRVSALPHAAAGANTMTPQASRESGHAWAS